MEKPTPATHRPAAVSPPLPWKTRLYISLVSTFVDAACRSDGTINRCLFSLVDFRSSASAKPVGGIRTADVHVDTSRNLWFRLFVPANSSGARIPVIIFFHGGGFVLFSAASRNYDDFCRRISREVGVLVVSVNYRLAPEHRYPAAYDDAADVLRFLDGGGLAAADPSAAELADLFNCFVVGDSAGGNIVHQVARRWAADASQERGWKSLRLAGMVLLQPFFGGEERTEAELRLAGGPLVSIARTDWMWRAFLPEGEDRDHEAANVFGQRATGELEAALPEALLVMGGFDPLQDWQRRYYEGMTVRGKAVQLLEYPDAIHGFYFFPEMKLTAELVAEIKGFVEAHRSPPN